ncbi:MAG: hypothetical protein QM817_33890 [Archangium sp.]
MRAAMLAATVWSSLVWADAFPPDGVTTMTTKSGQKMVWTVKRENDVVLINATHPNWSFENKSKPDGTPLSTTRRKDGKSTKVTYTATGAELEHTDAKGNVSKVTVKHAGLWDSDALDARLATVAWSKGKKVRFSIADVDNADGSVYPMVVEYVEETTCEDGEAKKVKCHHVRLALDDFRRMFAPTFDYFYAVEGGRYLRHEGDGFVFVTK